MFTISIGRDVDGANMCVCVSVEAGAIVPSDPFTLNHMSNLILVSRLN